MDKEDLRKIILHQKELISQLERRIESLQNELNFHKNKKTFSVDVESSTAEEVLREAIVSIQAHKWVDATNLISRRFGSDFMIKSSDGFRNLKEAMYAYFDMPEAPDRLDKTPKAEEDRKQRKAIKATVYTYIDRMGDYFMKEYEKNQTMK
jgi:hypothetical protein